MTAVPSHLEGRVAFVEAHAFGSGEPVQRYRLANGLSVLVLVDREAPVFSYQTWFAVGSRHEREGKTGLAHLFEHLMFNETERLPYGAFDRKLEEAGAESNAATWVDWTYYYENLPKDSLALATELESERMARLVLEEPQVAREKEVVMNERRMRVDDDVDGSVSELLYSTVFREHGYSWPTIGWMKDIEGFTAADCAEFYATYYAPNNATVVVVGDVDVAELLTLVAERYGALPAAALPAEDVRPEPPQTEPRHVEAHKPTETERLVVAYRGPALGDHDHAALSVVNDVLFAGRASRLFRALVQDGELAVDCRGWVSTFRDPGLYEISVTARPGVRAEALLEVLDRELSRIVEEPPTDDELERVKAKLELGALSGLQTVAGKAEQIGFWSTLTGDPSDAFRRLAAVRRLRADDLRRAARRYLTPSSRTVIFVRPSGEEPSGDDEETDA